MLAAGVIDLQVVVVEGLDGYIVVDTDDLDSWLTQAGESDPDVLNS